VLPQEWPGKRPGSKPPHNGPSRALAVGQRPAAEPRWTRPVEAAHRAEYWSERVLMMQEWADYLDELRKGGRTDKGRKVLRVSNYPGIAFNELSG
jgi:hypothetical protein